MPKQASQYADLARMPAWLQPLAHHLAPSHVAGLADLPAVAVNLMSRCPLVAMLTEDRRRLFCAGALLAAAASLLGHRGSAARHRPWGSLQHRHAVQQLMVHSAPMLHTLGVDEHALTAWFTHWEKLLISPVGVVTLARALCRAWHAQREHHVEHYSAVQEHVLTIVHSLCRHPQVTLPGTGFAGTSPASADAWSTRASHLLVCCLRAARAVHEVLRHEPGSARSWLACRDIACCMPDGSLQPLDAVLAWRRGRAVLNAET